MRSAAEKHAHGSARVGGAVPTEPASGLGRRGVGVEIVRVDNLM